MAASAPYFPELKASKGTVHLLPDRDSGRPDDEVRDRVRGALDS